MGVDVRFHRGPMRLLTPVVAVVLYVVPVTVLAGELTPDACRASDDAEVLADCIERRIYQPCDEAGGSVGDVRCVVGRKAVAERRIVRTTKRIAERSAKAGVVKRGSVDRNGLSQPPRDHVLEGNALWERYVREQCLFLNELYSVGLAGGERLGFCEAKLMEDRANLLERTLKRMVGGR